MTVTLKYLVPVLVTVDTSSRTVERVVVDDTDAEATEWWDVPDGAVSFTEALAAKGDALTIADEAEWPAWEIGS